MAATDETLPPTTYDLIEAWVSQQRQTPLPLTDKLRSAVLNFEYALKDASVSKSEPELGDFNWIGLLQGKATRPFKGSREIAFAESSFDPTGRGPLRFKCQASIGEAPGTAFPQAGESQPTFARKKDARKYAAKCAVEWLRANGYMPQGGGVKFPKNTIASPQEKQQPKATGNSPSKGQASSPTIPLSPLDADRPSAVPQVNELCAALGIPAPAYRIEGAGDGFYNGSADFGSYRALLPFDASKSCVDNVLSKKVAKEMIAEELLKQLMEEKQKRHAAIEDHIFKGLNRDSKDTPI